MVKLVPVQAKHKQKFAHRLPNNRYHNPHLRSMLLLNVLCV